MTDQSAPQDRPPRGKAEWLKSNVLGLVAIFIALSGTAVAAQVSGDRGSDGSQSATSSSAPSAHVSAGKRGPRGKRGKTGATGPAGSRGIQGVPGTPGIQGIAGQNGATGATGAAGASVAGQQCPTGEFVSGFTSGGQIICQRPPRECEDVDGDFFCVEENGVRPNDCNDNDAEVNPGEIEIPLNGKNDDCNNGTPDDPNAVDEDLDADGFTVAQGDCDDANADVNPDALEVPDNNQDDNCNGAVDEA